MPGFDRTGPMGRGPRTGGGSGYCGGPRSAGYGAGRGGRPWGGGRGRVYGGGRGRGGWYGPDYYYAPVPAMADDAEALKAAADDLRRELQSVEARLEELGKDR